MPVMSEEKKKPNVAAVARAKRRVRGGIRKPTGHPFMSGAVGGSKDLALTERNGKVLNKGGA